MATKNHETKKNLEKKSTKSNSHITNSREINKMIGNKTNNTYTVNDTVGINRLYLIPIVFILAILPLIIRFHPYETPLSQYPWFSYNNQYVDFFLYYKQWTFISTVFVMIIIIIARAYKDKSILKFSPIFIPLTVYGSFAFLSSIISEYRSYSFTGMFDQFESVWALLGYCLVVYYVFLFVQTEQDVKFVIKYLLIGVLILGLLGLTQFVGHDFITSEFGLKLITPNYYWSNLESINNIFFNNRVYLTLFNPNYVGVYVSLILPILFTLTIFNKNLRTLPIYLLAIVGMILCLVGSQSTAGLVATIAGVLLLLILLWRYLIKYFYITIPIILLSIGALFIFNMKADNYLLKQYSKLTEIKKSEPHLTDIQTLDDSITIKYNGNTLIVKFYVDNSGICYFDLLDDKSNTLPVSFEQINGPVTVLDERFPGFVFTPVIFNDKYAFSINASTTVKQLLV